MAKGEEQGGESLAAAGGDREGEKASGVICRSDTIIADDFARLMNGIVRRWREFKLAVGFECFEHLGENVVGP